MAETTVLLNALLFYRLTALLALSLPLFPASLLLYTALASFESLPLRFCLPTKPFPKVLLSNFPPPTSSRFRLLALSGVVGVCDVPRSSLLGALVALCLSRWLRLAEVRWDCARVDGYCACRPRLGHTTYGPARNVIVVWHKMILFFIVSGVRCIEWSGGIQEIYLWED